MGGKAGLAQVRAREDIIRRVLADGDTYSDFVRTEGAPAALLLEALLDALEDLAHELAVVDAEEVRELRRAAAALLERRLRRRGRDDQADLGRKRRDAGARWERPPPLRLDRRGDNGQVICEGRRRACEVVVQLGERLAVVLGKHGLGVRYSTVR